MAGLFDFSGRPHAAEIAVEHELDHETQVVGRLAPCFDVGTEERVEVEHLVDQLIDEAH